MKIGILTFHCASNYGAVLQTYALQMSLISMGHEVFILDYQPKFLISKKYILRKSKAKSNILKELLRSFATFPIRTVRISKFNKFIKKNLNTIPVDRYSQLDAIIVGSDQVWNPNITDGKFDETYLLDFVKHDKVKKISYAASSGNIYNFKNSLTDKQLKLIDSFNYISVREKSLADYLNTRLSNHKSIPTVLDPVILSNPQIYNKYLNKTYVRNNRYVLVFSLAYNPLLSRQAKKYASRKNLKVVELVSCSESFGHGVKETASIPQFLSLFYYADAIYTSSFHGTAFSILFNKPFIFIALEKTLSERSDNLLLALNIEGASYLSSEITADMETIPPKINYDAINKKLSILRNNAVKYLKESLGEI